MAARTEGTAEGAEREDSERVAGDRVLVDSSLWIEYFQPSGREEVQAAVRKALAGDRVGTTAIVLVEVLRGALTQESFGELEADLTALHWIEPTLAVARNAAAIGFDLERGGKRVPATDLMIAAAAIESGSTLWHNDAHFEVIAQNSTLAQRRLG